MAKGHNKPNQKVIAVPRRTRTATPIPFPTKNGVELRCPFCDDHHALLPNVESPCGTNIRVDAVQEVFPPSLVRKEKLICVKCHKEGGEMVRFRNTFVHTEDCSPEKKLLQDLPSSSHWARLVFSLPTRVKTFVEKYTGPTHQVLEIDEKGEKTGKVLAWIFLKESNAQRPTSSA